jgi:hypothetical protein
MSISFMIVAIGAMALSIAAATYHAYAARHQLPVSRPYDGPGSPMSLAGSGMVFTIMAMTGLGRGPLALVLVIGMGFFANVGLHALAGASIQRMSLLAPVLTAATVWHSGVF